MRYLGKCSHFHGPRTLDRIISFKPSIKPKLLLNIHDVTGKRREKGEYGLDNDHEELQTATETTRNDWEMAAINEMDYAIFYTRACYGIFTTTRADNKNSGNAAITREIWGVKNPSNGFHPAATASHSPGHRRYSNNGVEHPNSKMFPIHFRRR